MNQKNNPQEKPISKGLQFSHISHAYGDQNVLDDMSFDAEPGDITCLLGPSGCGKTTLLHIASGLVRPRKGQIYLGGHPLTGAPEHRPVGLVFQEGALFPHMNVADNIAFGMDKKGMDKKGRGKKDDPSSIRDLLDLIDMQGYEARYPDQLSGGQRQRVALMRALATHPRVLLLDEPFASVDMLQRRSLRAQIRQILKARDTISLMVTHDPEEALIMGDKIVIMDQGKMIQTGTPHDLYHHPATLNIAKMFGRGTYLEALYKDGELVSKIGTFPLTKPHMKNGPCHLFIRPEAVEIKDVTAPTGKGTRLKSDKGELKLVKTYRLSVTHIRPMGALSDVTFLSETKESFTFAIASHAQIKLGQKVELHIDLSHIHIFPS